MLCICLKLHFFITGSSISSLCISLLPFSTIYAMLLCRLLQFVGTVATQLGLEFQSARFMATRLSFHGRGRRPQCWPRTLRSLGHIHWFCHSWISTRHYWKKYSVDTAWRARTLWLYCQLQTTVALDHHSILSSSWSAENERMMTIVSYRPTMSAVSCRSVHVP